MCDEEEHRYDADELFKSLCRNLSENSEVELVSRDFGLLRQNSDRVCYANGLLLRYGLMPNLAEICKNNILSLKYRQEGNALFKCKKDQEALEKYTKSIAYAENGSENLGLAYANRSAVLFQNGLYKECLDDIKKASDNKYPVNLKGKLQQRAEKAQALKANQPDMKYHDELPCLSYGQNPFIQCASDCIEIKYAENIGRHIVATKDISIGEVVAVEKPFAKILLENYMLTHCHNCLAACPVLIPCEQCTTALFCGVKCKMTAWNSFHKHECAIWTTLVNMNVNKLYILALRVAICAVRNEHCYNLNSNQSVYHSENYKEIHELVANTEKRTVADLFERAVIAAIIFDLMQKYTNLFLSEGEQMKTLFKELLLLHMQTGPSNFHEISELVGSSKEHYHLEEIGSGAYSFLSLLNHSCNPNVIRHCYGSSIILRALTKIKQGQQLYDNYGYHYALMSKTDRQKYLNTQYHFVCSCEACVADWPLYQNLQAKDFDLEVEDGELSELRKGNFSTALKVLPKVLRQAGVLQQHMPCKDLSEIQEIMKQCYAILANKRNLL